MIPKIIHYCWFGGKELPSLTKLYIQSWKKIMPDYEIVEWNESNSPLDANDFIREALAAKQYAFVADYVRLYALYTMGGVYFDTDVMAIRSLTPFLQKKGFACFEGRDQYLVGTAVIGAEKGNDLICEFLSYYEKRHFSMGQAKDRMANTFIFRVILEKHGLIINGEEQTLDNGFVVYPMTFFSAKNNNTNKLNITKDTYCIHNFSETWISAKRKLKKLVLNYISYLKIRRIISSYYVKNE